MSAQAAAWAHAGFTAFVIAFQLALAAGAPWGRAAMGGRFPGRLPPPMRVASVVQATILAGLSGLVLARAGPGVWVAVAIGFVAAVLNLITPSRVERAIWGPVAVGLLATSVWVALTAA